MKVIEGREKSLLLFYGVLLLLFLALAWLRSVNGLIHAFDTGLYLQLLTGIWNEGSLASSLTGEANFLGHHFQPVVYLLAPLMAVSQSPFILMLVGALAIALSMGLIWQYARSANESGFLPLLFAGTLLLHPSVASRVFYSFVPEVIALPFLTFLALQLVRSQPPRGRDWFMIVMAEVMVLACKESLIPGLVLINFLFAWRWRREAAVKIFVLLAVLFAALFFYIFLVWMPAHSVMTTYYATSFYGNPGVDDSWGPLSPVIAAILNVFSPGSLSTALLLFLVLPLGLCLAGSPLLVMAALWPLALILASRSPQLHSLMNHYALPAVPFLVISALHGWKKWNGRIPATLRRYVTIGILAVPLAYTFMADNGLAYYGLFTLNNHKPELMEQVETLRKSLPKDDLVLIDGSLQSLFPELRRTHVILGFQGNPYRLKEEDLSAARHIITTNDLSALPNCRDLKPGEIESAIYDYEGFYRYCEWLKSHNFKKSVLVEGRLIHLEPLP